MAGPLTQSPLSSAFWSAMGQGANTAVAQPIAQDLRGGHRALNEAYPLPYQIAQMHPAVGIPAAAMNYMDAADVGDTDGMIRASLSAVPVAEKAFRLGHALPTLRQAGAVSNAQHGVNLAPATGAVYKTAAAQNVTEMGEAGYNQFAPNTRRPPNAY